MHCGAWSAASSGIASGTGCSWVGRPDTGGCLMKTRFAPSPTGYIHLGNVRTALFNWLAAHAQQGRFLLRIEDTDLERSETVYQQALMEDLRWLGLDWDEGPDASGDAGPYLQSERSAVYTRYFELLQEKGMAYPCFCTAQELSVSRKLQRSAGRPPRYAGTCAGLSAQEVEAKKQRGLPFTLRFRVPRQGSVSFIDGVRGRQEFSCQDIGDFIIRKSDGSPSFFFSNAIDDALMGVTHVLRGEDHLTNTPRQQMLLEALELKPPEYAHISLIVGGDGAPLSKRHGSKSVRELREQGYLPLGVVNYLARLGHHYENEAFMSMESLAQHFQLQHLGKAPAHFQEEQLLHWQHEAILHADDQQLWQWMSLVERDGLTITQLVPAERRNAFVHAVRDNLTMPDDALDWAANLFCESGIYAADAENIIREAGSGFFQAAVASLADAQDQFKSFAGAVGTATGTKGKKLYMPLRAAISGELYAQGWNSDWARGPQMAVLWELLGAARIRRRLELAAALAAGG